MSDVEKHSKLLKMISYFSLGLIILIVTQISLGASIRLTGSGLSCPDWPLCYGLWIPLKSKLLLIEDVNYEYYQIMLEWIHRLNAALLIVPVTLFVSISTIVVSKVKSIKILAYFVLLILLIQGLMGGLTVFDKNSPWSVAVHLGLALLLLFFVIKIFMFSKNMFYNRKINLGKKKLFVFVCTLLAIFLTMLMGAIVSKTGSSLACDLWPSCSNDNISILQTNKFIHLLHRFLALISACFVFWSLFLLREHNKIFEIKLLSIFVLIILFFQIFMGAMVIILELNMVIAMIHQILAVLLFMMISVIIWISLDLNYKIK